MARQRLAAPAVASAVLALVAALAGCGPDEIADGAPPERPLLVAVTVPPQAYLVERIGGERVTTEVLMPPGSSEESWSPSPRQMVALTRADLYVLVGHPAFAAERRHVTPVLADNPQVPVVDMSAGMGLELDEHHQHDAEPEDHTHAGGAGDPHVWTSPRLMRAAAVTIAEALARRDPQASAAYGVRLAALLDEIDALDAEIRRELSGLSRRRFLVTHPAWGHLASDYGLVQVAIEEEGKEPSPAHLVALAAEARAEGVPVVFTQKGFPENAAHAVAREIGARAIPLDPLARDWLDNTRKTARSLAAALR